VDWSLQSECDVWPSAGRACSGHGTPPDPSSVSDPLPLIGRWGPISEEGWSPAWPSTRQCVARDANMCRNPLDMDAGNFADGREVKPDRGAN